MHVILTVSAVLSWHLIELLNWILTLHFIHGIHLLCDVSWVKKEEFTFAAKFIMVL